ncbi:IS110 family transposase [[Clostridium] saccharogumia]|nr:IS110 family transposase [Thomasclavelia saccharogumia]
MKTGYSKPSQIIKSAGITLYHYESSQFNAQYTAITKKGFKYLRKTLYQIILPVINNNPCIHSILPIKDFPKKRTPQYSRLLHKKAT